MTDIVLSPIDARASVLVEAAVVAESAGFEAIWTYDHISGIAFGGRPVLDVWTVLASIAASTTRVGVGPLVINTVARHPAHVAVATATLQDLSGGRVRLGLGAGAGPESPYSRELAMVGLPVMSSARATSTRGRHDRVRAVRLGARSQVRGHGGARPRSADLRRRERPEDGGGRRSACRRGQLPRLADGSSRRRHGRSATRPGKRATTASE